LTDGEYREYRREEIYTGESYRVVEAQSENETEEKSEGTDLLNEFVQGASKYEVLKIMCVIIPVTF
jgi:hypothetical protein